MSHTRIKICGITRPEDAEVAAACGVDAIGLVFYPASPRAVDIEQARTVVSALPPFVTVTALFVSEPAENIQRILSSVAIDVIQFHGDETADFCRQFQRPYLKALRVQPSMDIAAAAANFHDARAILLDAWQDGVPGGTGTTFDWQLAAGVLAQPVVLAGGLNPTNVGLAITTVKPAAVDVSGGVERSPGIKDPQAIKQFIEAVRAADQRQHG